MFTGFIEASADAINKANDGFSIINSVSPFQLGVKFRINGSTFKVSTDNGVAKADARLNAVLLSPEVGDVFLSMLAKPKTTSDGKTLEPTGKFNLYVRDFVVKSKKTKKTDGEILNALVEFAKDKTFTVVSRVPFINQYNNAQTLINIDYEKTETTTRKRSSK